MRLKDRVCVVTGATSGLGAAIARRFADEGALLIIHGRDEQRGRALVDELGKAPGGAPEWYGDITAKETNDAIVERAREHHGRIDVLVLNAGVFGGFGRFWEHDASEFDRLVAINVKAPWLGVRAAEPLLGEGASVIVNTSVSAFVMYPDETLYSMNKGAATALMKGMANDLGGRGTASTRSLRPEATARMARVFYDE